MCNNGSRQNNTGIKLTSIPNKTQKKYLLFKNTGIQVSNIPKRQRGSNSLRKIDRN